MDFLEIEVKFFLPDMASVRKIVEGLGAKSLGREFETNIRFEDEKHTFAGTGRLLRLRKDSKAKLTFKSRSAQSDDQFKVRRELEVEVSDYSTMKLILESLGFKT